jgi:putative FmdB family regulatory protein
MPIFEYRCSSCGHLEEVLQKHTDPAPSSCPRCQATSTMAKALSLSAFHLKGGGWYKDLYATPSSSTDTAASAASSSASSSEGPAAATASQTPASTSSSTAAAPASSATAAAAASSAPASSTASASSTSTASG